MLPAAAGGKERALHAVKGKRSTRKCIIIGGREGGAQTYELARQ